MRKSGIWNDLKSPETLIPNIAKVGVESSNLFARSSRDQGRQAVSLPLRGPKLLPSHPSDPLGSKWEAVGSAKYRIV